MKNYFKFKELLSLQCFSPSLTSSHFTLRERCKDKTLAVVSFGKENFKVGKVSFKKWVHLENVQTFHHTEADKAWSHIEMCSSERLIALTWGFKVHYAFEKEAGIQKEMRGLQTALNESYLKGFCKESDYLAFEKEVQDKGFKLMRTQLTVLNLFHAMLKEKNVSRNDLMCVVDQGVFTAFRLDVGKLRHMPIPKVLNEELKEDLEDILNGNFSGRIYFSVTEASEFNEKFFNFLGKDQTLIPFQSNSLRTANPELELLAYE